MIELIKANAKFFFITWGIVLLVNQIFIFGGCLAPYCIVAALPHTGVISAVIVYLNFQEEKEQIRKKDRFNEPQHPAKNEKADPLKEMGDAYEKEIGKAFECKGDFVIYNGLIRGFYDGGVDLIVISPNSQSINFVQCKNWQNKNMEYRIPPGTEAVEKLEDFIVVNRLAPNTRIPSERDLCEMWGVSRTTLRQAVDTLVGRGVLYRVNGAGVYVSVGKKNRNMVGVDSMVGELRQQGSILAKKIISVRKVEATKQISKKLHVLLGQEVYEYILLRKIDDVPCFLETTYLDCERYPDFEKYYTDKTSMGRILKNVYHRKQISGEEHISVTYASEQEAALLEIIPDSPLFFTSGVVKDEEGVIIMYYKQLIRGDKFKLVSRIESE